MKPILLGFWGLSPDDYGDSDTPQPYPVVTPSRVGSILLPFPCPHCTAVHDEMVDPVRRAHYEHRAGAKTFYWCPECSRRYEIDLAGAPLDEPLPAGATYAPAARIENPPADGAKRAGALLGICA